MASSPLSGLKAPEIGPPPVANGEPDTGVGAPVPSSTMNTDTELLDELPSATKGRSGLKVTELTTPCWRPGQPADLARWSC